MYQLYLDNYKDKLPEKDLVSQAVYRKVFNEEYNFSFHIPKKDQCSLCVKYYRDKDNGSLSPEMKEDFEQHQQRKVRAREEKKKDKEMAKNSKDFFLQQRLIFRPFCRHLVVLSVNYTSRGS